MYEYTGYNSLNKYQLETVKIKSGGVWVNYTQRSIQYYANQYQPQYVEEFTWDTFFSQWNNWRRYYYTFNQDSLSSKTTSVPLGSGWIPFSKTSINYSSFPFLKTDEFYQEWDTTVNPAIWQYKDRILYTYTASDSIERIQHEVMTSTGWFPVTRTNYVYNVIPRLAEEFTELYSGSWNMDRRKLYTYTGDKLTEMNEFYGLSGSWIPERKTMMDYAPFDSLIYKQVDTFDGAAFYPNKRFFYYYQLMTVGVEDWNEAGFKSLVYPNPAVNCIQIITHSDRITDASFRITDLLGRTRLIRQEPLVPGKNAFSIDLSALPDGYYRLQRIDADGRRRMSEAIHVLH
jgi:hypothetical protein